MDPILKKHSQFTFQNLCTKPQIHKKRVFTKCLSICKRKNVLFLSQFCLISKVALTIWVTRHVWIIKKFSSRWIWTHEPLFRFYHVKNKHGYLEAIFRHYFNPLYPFFLDVSAFYVRPQSAENLWWNNLSSQLPIFALLHDKVCLLPAVLTVHPSKSLDVMLQGFMQ